MRKLLKKDCFSLPKKSDLPFSLIAPFYDKVREKELSHSEMLKTLLNPTMNHSHGTEFLDLVLDEIGLHYKSSVLTNITVETERGTKLTETSTSRPIDILITYNKKSTGQKKYAIIIENKLNYAIDQKNQINDYYDGLVRENYEIEKVVYMHINPRKTIEDTDTRADLKVNTYNFDALCLIKTLSCMNGYSYISEYKNLLEHLSHNFMNINHATTVQEELNDEELAKLIQMAELIKSSSWNEAKHKKIVNELALNNLENSFNKNHSSFHFHGTKYWAEVWYYPTCNKVYICSYQEVVELVDVNNHTYKLWGEYQGRYFYEKDNNEYQYPGNNLELISEITSILKYSK